jgi:hypothetical protein
LYLVRIRDPASGVAIWLPTTAPRNGSPDSSRFPNSKSMTAHVTRGFRFVEGPWQSQATPIMQYRELHPVQVRQQKLSENGEARQQRNRTVFEPRRNAPTSRTCPRQGYQSARAKCGEEKLLALPLPLCPRVTSCRASIATALGHAEVPLAPLLTCLGNMSGACWGYACTSHRFQVTVEKAPAVAQPPGAE